MDNIDSQKILQENKILKDENKELRNLLGFNDSETDLVSKIKNSVTNKSSVDDKIDLFQSLFKGRDDLFATRWESRKGKSGYSPVCLNEWKEKLCFKPKVKCSNCNNRFLKAITKSDIYDHLAGFQTIGIYPLLKDETTFFLAIDFDKSTWIDDTKLFLKTWLQLNIDAYIEKSRSGNGAHIWIFFEKAIQATLARKLGFVLLTETMQRGGSLNLDSYDRLFPNQDNMPIGGFGNLIALPLQKRIRKDGNTEFLDTNYNPYIDQWVYLSNIKKVTGNKVQEIVNQHKKPEGNLGIKEYSFTPNLFNIEVEKELENNQHYYDSTINITLQNQIYITKKSLSPNLRYKLLRLASFSNPEFYKAQALRLSTHNIPKIINCSTETPNSLILPRGCIDELNNLFNENELKYKINDLTNSGANIETNFKGNLTEKQFFATEILKQHDFGVLSAHTGFGKTVLAAYMISQRKVNTLILVHRKELLEQWKERLSLFLGLKSDEIGVFGSGIKKLTGKIDIAMLASVNYRNEVKDFIKDYGQVIVDECHHIAAVSFEEVMKKIKAKYILGLTATPIRKDGLHPIIFYQCGIIRYKIDSKEYIRNSAYKHIVLPREISTNFDSSELSIQDIYSKIINIEERNNLIFEDVLKELEQKRSPLLLTERIEHLEYFEKRLTGFVKNLIVFKGGMGKKQRDGIYKKMKDIKDNEERLIISTGKYIGEGFDDARLDTLFLAMPISWKGTLQQYVGRLHRDHINKRVIKVFDYVDLNIEKLYRMYKKRLKGYKNLGYEVVDGK